MTAVAEFYDGLLFVMIQPVHICFWSL